MIPCGLRWCTNRWNSPVGWGEPGWLAVDDRTSHVSQVFMYNMLRSPYRRDCHGPDIFHVRPSSHGPMAVLSSLSVAIAARCSNQRFGGKLSIGACTTPPTAQSCLSSRRQCFSASRALRSFLLSTIFSHLPNPNHSMITKELILSWIICTYMQQKGSYNHKQVGVHTIFLSFRLFTSLRSYARPYQASVF